MHFKKILIINKKELARLKEGFLRKVQNMKKFYTIKISKKLIINNSTKTKCQPIMFNLLNLMFNHSNLHLKINKIPVILKMSLQELTKALKINKTPIILKLNHKDHTKLLKTNKQ